MRSPGPGHLVEHWQALGGACTLAVSGDERARRIGAGKHPFLEEALPCPAVDLGEDLARAGA